MPKFRKLPVIVEAEQYTEGKTLPEVQYDLQGRRCINTSQGAQYLNEGDWVVTEEGRRRVMDGQLFERTYERVADNMPVGYTMLTAPKTTPIPGPLREALIAASVRCQQLAQQLERDQGSSREEARDTAQLLRALCRELMESLKPQ